MLRKTLGKSKLLTLDKLSSLGFDTFDASCLISTFSHSRLRIVLKMLLSFGVFEPHCSNEMVLIKKTVVFRVKF